jgi:ADP-L-glycero-D-manno-heptose 6-epimerase
MIIVTGGAGFIGSNLIWKLNQIGIEDILVVDNLSQADKHRNLNSLKIADFLDKEDFLAELPRLKNVQTIFHQGACSSTTETDGRYMMENNFQFSKILLHHSLDHKIDFLYASSASIYGDGSAGFREERACEWPLNVYAFSKFAFDNYVRQHLSQTSSQILGLRYFNVYGPQENHKGKMASVAFHLFGQLAQSQKMKLFAGSEDFRRDFIYVDDVVQMNLHFFQTKGNGIFNAGTGEARSFLDIATTLQQLEPTGQIETIPFPNHLQGKYQEFTEADTERLRKAGYERPMTSLEVGLSQYYDLWKRTDGYRRE